MTGDITAVALDIETANLDMDAEGLAFGDVEADAAHGVHHLVAADGELDFEIPDRQEDVVIVTQRSVSGTGH